MNVRDQSLHQASLVPDQGGIRQPSRTVCLILLGLILLTGAWFRFHNITEYEPIIADEAAYHMEARYLYDMAERAVTSFRLKQEERKTGENLWTREQETRRFQEEPEGLIPWYSRPWHIYLIALTMIVWSPETVWLGGLVSAVFGTLCILLVYALGTRLHHRNAGLLAAALFSLSGYQVAYSHTGLTEQDSLFFLLLAGLIHFWGTSKPDRSRWKYLILTGLSLGACFVIHYRMLNSILAFFVWEAFFQTYDTSTSFKNWKRRSASILILTGAMATPIILTEVPYYVLTLMVHFLTKGALPFNTYFEQLFGQIGVSLYTNLMSTQKVFSLSNVLTYPFLVWKLDGPIWPVALLAALLAAFWRRRTADAWMLVLFLVPFLTSTFLQPRARYACSFLAFGALLIASALTVSANRGTWYDKKATLFFRGLLAAVLLIVSTFYAHKHAQPRVSYRPAMNFMQSQGTVKHIATYPLVTMLYSGIKNTTVHWPDSDEGLRELYDEGYRFVIVDALKDLAFLYFGAFDMLDDDSSLKKRLDVFSRIEEELEPVFSVENLHVNPIQGIFEVNHNFSKTLEVYRKLDEYPAVKIIRVYDLRERYEGLGSEENTP